MGSSMRIGTPLGLCRWGMPNGSDDRNAREAKGGALLEYRAEGEGELKARLLNKGRAWKDRTRRRQSQPENRYGYPPP